MCKASIIIPAYNSANYIAKTIDSILKQSFSDFECIIIDDGSKDDTVAVIKSFSDKRIKLLAKSNSEGPAKPRNAGLAAATGEYIFMFDSDDLMHPNKLAHSIAALDAYRDADILFTNFSSIDENDRTIKQDFLEEYSSLWNLIGGRLLSGDVVKIPSQKIYSALIKINFIGTSSVVLRKNSLSKNDIFNEELKNSDDRLFWVLFTKNHNAIFLNEILHQYRIQPNSISNQGFVRRGPSKIAALKIIFCDCEDKALKKYIRRQISNDYATLAYAFRVTGNSVQQRKAALTGLKWSFNLRLAKLLLQSMVEYKNN